MAANHKSTAKSLCLFVVVFLLFFFFLFFFYFFFFFGFGCQHTLSTADFACMVSRQFHLINMFKVNIEISIFRIQKQVATFKIRSSFLKVISCKSIKLTEM